MTSDRLTCLIPTHNRPHFLRRLWQYYQQFPLSCSFMVADSSHPAAAAENLAAIEQARGSLEISYRHFDGAFYDKCCQALQKVRTPHVVLCADDDYLLPSSVDHCLGFLENHPDYAIAQGLMAIVNRPGRAPYASSGFTIDASDPLDRWQTMSRYRFPTFYGVHRTEMLSHIFRVTTENLDCAHSHFFPERMLLQLSVLSGCVKVFPEVYCLHQVHDACMRWTPRVSDPERGAELEQQFRTCLADHLEQHGISRTKAERWIESSYGYELKVASSGHKRFPILRLQQFLRKTAQQLMNPFVRDGVLYRRSLTATDWLGQEAAWQEALRLMATHPNGLHVFSESQQLAG